MTHRRLPFVTRLLDDVRGTVRTGLEASGSLRAVLGTRRDEPLAERQSGRRADGGRARVAEGESCTDDAGPPDADGRPPGRGAVDPDAGPTSRAEILEYGYSPAQYVRAVVAKHGGRVKQRRFADAYGWSPSTISRLLTELEERGAIDRYRVGREKVVALPGEVSRSSVASARGGETGGDSNDGDSEPDERGTIGDGSRRPG